MAADHALPILEATHLSKRFDDGARSIVALEDASLSIRKASSSA
jgi:hypothetical protein